MENYLSWILSLLTSHLFLAICILALGVYAGVSRKIRALPRIPLWPLITYLILKIASDKFSLALNVKHQKLLEFALSTAYYCAIARLVFFFAVERYYLWKKKLPLPTISRDFSLIIIYAVIALIFMRTKGGINLAGILTTSAVMTAAIGLAAQNTLSNLFSGLSIQLDNPFGVGDWIRVGDSVGQVVEIGWKSTRLRTQDDEIFTLPNLEITKSIIKNYSRPTDRLVMKIGIGVEYGAAPSAVEKALLEACSQEPMVEMSPPPQVRLIRFDDFAISYELRVIYHGFQNRPVLIANLNRLIYYSLKRAGIEIPFPIRDIRHHHIEKKAATQSISSARAEVRRDLDSIALLSGLGPSEKDEMTSCMDVLVYGAGEAIVRQGDEGDCAYIIYSGTCDVIIDHGDGVKHKVARLMPHTMFGEMSLLTGARRVAEVRAAEDCTLFKVGKESFAKILSANPSLSEKMAELLAKREAEIAEHAGVVKNLENQKGAVLDKIKKFFGIR